MISYMYDPDKGCRPIMGDSSLLSRFALNKAPKWAKSTARLLNRHLKFQSTSTSDVGLNMFDFNLVRYILWIRTKAGSLYTITTAMVIYVNDLPWARVRFGPVPLASC